MRSARQIAIEVLTKLSSDEGWNAPQMAMLGGGAGLGAGVLGAGALHHDDINSLLKLHYRRPKLEEARIQLKKLLKEVRTQNPQTKDLNMRQLTKVILSKKNEISPEAYHVARRGYEEGVSGLSRNLKLTNLMKRRLLHGGGIGAGLGLGAGVGAGLLAALGTGKFDEE